jgi:cobalt-zinc-cadmium efflux system outer membrane protein
MDNIVFLALKKPILNRFLKRKLTGLGRIAMRLGLLASLFTYASAHAQSANLSWQEAARLTLEQSPSLTAFGYELDAQAGRIQQAGLKPNPELSLTVEDAAGSGDFKSMDSAETTLAISWILEGTQRRERVKAAEAANAVLTAERDIKRLDALASTARWYAQAMALQAQAKQAQSALATAEEAVKFIGQRVRVGNSPAAELARAEVELANRRLEREDISHEQAIAHRQLAAQWGETRVPFTAVAADINQIPASLSFAELQARLQQHPRLQFLVTRERLEESRIALAQSQGKAQWHVSAGIKQLTATDDQALVAGVSVPLTVFDRQQGRVIEARALAALSRAEREAEQITLDTAVFSLHQEFTHSLHRLQSYRTQIIPALENALKETRRAYDSGRYSYQEWVGVQRELSSAQQQYLDTALAAHLQSIEIERLTGISINAIAATRSAISE